MGMAALDLSREATSFTGRPIGEDKAWLAADISEDDWLLAGDDGITNPKTLFHPGMEIKAHGGIRRHEEPDFYTYSVKPFMGDKGDVLLNGV